MNMIPLIVQHQVVLIISVPQGRMIQIIIISIITIILITDQRIIFLTNKEPKIYKK
jgi:hypothetical protein